MPQNKGFSMSDKQKEFWNNCNHRWNIKCGATRSGKTFLDYYLIPKRIRSLRDLPGLYVLLGSTKTTLQRNIIEPLQKIWGNALVSDIKADNTAILFGEKVHCMGAEKVTQVNHIRGSSIKYCYGDEVVTWHQDVFNMVKSRLDKEYSRFDGTCNPETPEHWFKKFIDNKEIDIFYQHYSMYDNPFLPASVVRNFENEYAGSVYFDRFIKGLWVRAEGIIFPTFAADPKPWIINPETESFPKKFRWCEIGFDIGGNGSAYALTATAQGYDNKYYVLKSKKTQANRLNMQDIEKLTTEFCRDVEKKYDTKVRVMNCDHVAAIVNSLNVNTPYRADFTYKPPLVDRPFVMTKLLANHVIAFVENECDDLIDELQNLVYDKSAGKTIPLDDGTMQIDTWDSWTYSVSGHWTHINI